MPLAAPLGGVALLTEELRCLRHRLEGGHVTPAGLLRGCWRFLRRERVENGRLRGQICEIGLLCKQPVVAEGVT